MKAKKLYIPDYDKLNVERRPARSTQERWTYFLTVLISFLLLFAANRRLASDLPELNFNHPGLRTAEVVEILSRDSKPSQYIYEDGSPKGIEQTKTIFRAKLTSGADKGALFEAEQNIVSLIEGQGPANLVQKGDRVFIAENVPGSETGWALYGFRRTRPLLWLFLAFAILIVIFGRLKGLNTLLSLLFTCGAVFLVLVPALLSGRSPYLWTALVCFYIIGMSLLLINGLNEKTLAAGAASVLGMSVAALLMKLMDMGLHLTGIVDEESTYLIRIIPGLTLDLKAILFSAIMLGSTGAVMDVSMDIASALRELSQTSEGRAFPQLLKSGFAIGKDSIGTMANTLILAYVGGSLGSLLLLVALNMGNMTYLLNSEGMVAELLQMLIGAFSMLFTIPFAALICGLLYTREKKLKTVSAD